MIRPADPEDVIPTRPGAAVRYAQGAGAAAATIGALTMLGWWLGMRRLTDVLPGWPTMKPVTASLCILAGAALALLAAPRRSRLARTFASICAAGAGALALITIVEHLSGARAGLDRLLAGGPVGLPVLRTAVSFALVSAAVLCLDYVTPGGRSPAQFMALAGGVIPTIALLGYAFGLPALHSARQSATAGGMAFHTATALVLLSSGTLAARPAVGLMGALASEHAGGMVARRLLLALAAFAPVALLVIAGHHIGWYGDSAIAPLLVFLALVTGVVLILVTAVRLNRYDVRQKSTEALLRRREADLAQARETDRQLRTDLERVTRAAMNVSEAVADLPTGDMSALLHTIALEAQVLTGAQYVGVGLGIDPGKPFDPWVVLGVPPEVADKIGRHPRPIATLGLVARDGATLRTADLHRHPDFRGFPPHHPEMSSLLGVPIHYRGRPLGNLYLANKKNATEFSLQDQRMVEMLAGRAAVAIETANLYTGEARQRAWLRTIIDQMPEGVIILDAGGHVVAVNRAMLAYAHEDTGGRDRWGNPTIFDVRTPDGGPVAFEELPVVQALERGEPIVGHELALRQRDGRLVPVITNAAPVRDDGGHITGATVIVQDITPLKELERLREEWASVVAHDLRQPVSAISLAVEGLLRWCAGDESSRERRSLKHIRSSVTRLSRMIGDLLDASQIEAKRLAVAPEATDLAALTDSVVDSLRQATEGHDVRLDVRPGLGVWIDPDRVRQVLTNLVSNAIKYGEDETPILIEAADRGPFIEVTVANRGPGIAPDELPLIFSRFGRTRAARAAGKPGSGLGLYISKGLVEAQGGRMWVDSVPGDLTTFHFLLPKAPLDAGLSAGTEGPPPM